MFRAGPDSFTFCAEFSDLFLSSLCRKEITVWFPIMSVVVFLSTMLVLNRPSLIPSMFFFSIATIMYFICYNRSANPSPWKRCMVCSIVYL